MPWKNVTPMEEIIRFVMLAQSARFTVSELCEQFGISRKTGYKHLDRYAAEGLKGLAIRSHRPHQFPQRTDAAVEALIVAERGLHRTWGPKKLHKVLELKHGIESPPARSTIGEILRRHGLSVQRRRKPGSYDALNHGLTVPTRPNHVWTVDFKGWFELGDGQRCDPLTVCDRYSRYLLACRAQPNQQFKGTLRTFQALMRQAGVPEVIRVDHGTPFASIGLGRLSSLSIWWIEQGIAVEFTHLASPQDNGSHERMHRDLKAEAITLPSANQAAQQRRFERWRHTYNHERPHESLDQQRPCEFYQPSSPGSMRATNRSCIRQTLKSSASPRVASWCTKEKAIMSGRRSHTNAWASISIPQAKLNCISPTSISVISPVVRGAIPAFGLHHPAEP